MTGHHHRSGPAATPETLTAWTLAAAVEHELIRLEAAAGESIAFATRPLTGPEKKAKTRFQDIDDIVSVNTLGGVNLIAGLYGAVVGGVLAELFGDDENTDEDTTDEQDAIEAAALTAALALLLSYRPKTYKKLQEDTAEQLHGLVSKSYTGGVATVLDEAKRQGVDIKGWERPVTPVALTVLARDISDHPWQRVVERALHEYQTPAHLLGGPMTRGELEEFFNATSQAGTLDLLHQANQSALGRGRMDTAANYVGEFIAAFASEILDKNTCDRCASIDGTRFDTPEDAQAAYPTGTYKNCLGGSRCRGVVVWVFDSPDD